MSRSGPAGSALSSSRRVGQPRRRQREGAVLRRRVEQAGQDRDLAVGVGRGAAQHQRALVRDCPRPPARRPGPARRTRRCRARPAPASSRPCRKVAQRSAGWRWRSAITRAAKSVSSRPVLALGQRPVDPRGLVVLAVGVVVAVLGAAELVAGQQHRRALRQEHRGQHGALQTDARGVDRRIVGSGPRRPSWPSSCRRGRRCCPRRWPRCGARRSSRCRAG